MRCAKCGYVTFDRPGECPRCGKSLPEPLVAAAVAAPSSSRAGRPAFLSSLMLGPIPRFYGDPGDPGVPSLLEPEAGGPAGEIGEAEGAVQPPKLGGEEPAEAAVAEEPSLDEPAGGMEEPSLRDETPPAVRAREAAQRPRRRQEPAEVPPPGETEDLLASMDMEELSAGPKASVSPGPKAAESDLSIDAIGEEDLFPLEDAAASSPAPVRGVAAEAKGEEDEELAGLLASDAEEGSPAAAKAPSASSETDDLLALLDAADEAAPSAAAGGPPRAQAPRDESPADLLPDEMTPGEDAPAAAPAPPAAGGEEDISSLWAEAFTEEEQAAPSAAAPADLLEETAGETAPGAGKKEVTPPVGASAGGGEDSLSDMWSEAFAEQEAVTKAQREVGAPSAREGDAGDLGDGDLEKMWSEALDESGEAPAARASAKEAPDEEPPAAGGEPLAKEDLGDVFGEEEAAPAAPGAAADVEEAPAAETGQDARAPRSGAGLLEDEDSEEIEAYVPEDAPAAAEEPKPAGGDFLDDAGAPPEEPEDEGQTEVVGVPIAARLVAGAVDFGVLAALQGLFLGISFGIVGKAVSPVSSSMEALILLGVLNLAVLFVLSLSYSVYFVGMFGCTPGQRIMGLSVVDADDKPVEYMQAVLRYFGGLGASVPLGMGHLLVIFDKKSRGVGDRLAGTHVVQKVKV